MDNSNLVKLQQVLLKILNDVTQFCEQENIEYFLGGGTLLGAVRNNGFIPWDDDADIMMTRENYNKFVKIAIDKLPKEYFVQSWENDPNWHYGYTKIRLNNTVFSTQFTKQFKNLHQGIFIDIFVQDNTVKSKILQKIQIFEIRLWHSVVRYLWRKQDSRESVITAPLPAKILSKFVNLKKAKQKLNFAMQKYNSKSTELLLDSSGMHLKYGGYSKNWLTPVKKCKFENKEFFVPNNSDAYLTSLYGDYKTPKQFESHDAGTVVDFGKY